MRAMCAYVPKACQHFIFTCKRANMPKTCHFSNWLANVPKDVPIFQLFFKEQMFQLWLKFADFKNAWAILENLSRETKNLKHNILRFACFSHAHHKSF